MTKQENIKEYFSSMMSSIVKPEENIEVHNEILNKVPSIINEKEIKMAITPDLVSLVNGGGYDMIFFDSVYNILTSQNVKFHIGYQQFKSFIFKEDDALVASLQAYVDERFIESPDTIVIINFKFKDNDLVDINIMDQSLKKAKQRIKLYDYKKNNN